MSPLVGNELIPFYFKACNVMVILRPHLREKTNQFNSVFEESREVFTTTGLILIFPPAFLLYMG